MPKPVLKYTNRRMALVLIFLGALIIALIHVGIGATVIAGVAGALVVIVFLYFSPRLDSALHRTHDGAMDNFPATLDPNGARAVGRLLISLNGLDWKPRSKSKQPLHVDWQRFRHVETSHVSSGILPVSRVYGELEDGSTVDLIVTAKVERVSSAIERARSAGSAP